MRGVRPVAASTSSAWTVVAVVQLQRRRCPSLGRPRRALDRWCRPPSRTSTPASAQAVRDQLARRTARCRPSSRSARASSVTWVPSACQAVAISQPTTPPPITTRRRRHLAWRWSPRGWSTAWPRPAPAIGGISAPLPVATATACRAVSSTVRAVGRGRRDLRAPVSRPWPRTRSMPRAVQPARPARRPSSAQANSSRRASTSAASSAPARPRRAAHVLGVVAAPPTGRSSALHGMQAQYEHSPPTSSRLDDRRGQPAPDAPGRRRSPRPARPRSRPRRIPVSPTCAPPRLFSQSSQSPLFDLGRRM